MRLGSVARETSPVTCPERYTIGAWRTKPGSAPADPHRAHDEEGYVNSWRSKRGLIGVIGTLALTISACSGSEPTEPDPLSAQERPSLAAVSIPSIAGDWVWTHRTVFVIPTDVAATIVPPVALPFLDGPNTRIECHVSGTADLVQNGASFSGSATQESDCALKEGPSFPMLIVYQSTFDISNGEITGRSLQFDVLPFCHNQGNLTVDGSTVTAWRVSGECEPPIPVNPAVGKTISWEAERA